jgi:ankyrin repeat protein
MSLFKHLPVEINIIILMNLNSDDIHKIGKEKIPEYVWLRKEYNNVEEAARNGNLICMKYLIEEQKIDIRNNNNYALNSSIRGGHLNVVKYLVEERGANIHRDNNSALQISVKNGHIDVVKYLIDQGADIHANNEWILYYGISRGHLDIVKVLVEKGINIRLRYDEALQWAAEHGQLNIVKYLTEYYVESSPAISETPVLNNIYVRAPIPVINNIQNDTTKISTILSMNNIHLIVVQYLIRQGSACVNSSFGYDYSLQKDLSDVHLEIIKYLIEYNAADIYANYNRALQCSAECGRVEVVKYLVEQGADIRYALQCSIEH